jgi:hypothetical protein
MTQSFRDNLIYLTVGLGIAALVAADFFFADSRGRIMWMPSRFAFRLASTTALLGYFVVREALKAKATVIQALTCALFASMLHLMIWFSFRRILGQLSGLTFSALAVIEFFLLVQLVVQGIQYLKSQGQRG